jgi:hypothetical protein
MYWWRNLGRMMQSGSSRSMRPGVVTGQKIGKKSWRKTRIKLSKASWSGGKKYLLPKNIISFFHLTVVNSFQTRSCLAIGKNVSKA